MKSLFNILAGCVGLAGLGLAWQYGAFKGIPTLSEITSALKDGYSSSPGQQVKLVNPIPPALVASFDSSCERLQRYANEEIDWINDESFEGFEHSKMRFYYPTDYSNYPKLHADPEVFCRDGYITERSPMGKRVCQGNLVYRAYSDEWKWFANERKCRWRY